MMVLSATTSTATSTPSTISCAAVGFVEVDPRTTMWVVIRQKICRSDCFHFFARAWFRAAHAKDGHKGFVVHIGWDDNSCCFYFGLFLGDLFLCDRQSDWVHNCRCHARAHSHWQKCIIDTVAIGQTK